MKIENEKLYPKPIKYQQKPDNNVGFYLFIALVITLYLFVSELFFPNSEINIQEMTDFKNAFIIEITP